MVFHGSECWEIRKHKMVLKNGYNRCENTKNRCANLNDKMKEKKNINIDQFFKDNQ